MTTDKDLIEQFFVSSRLSTLSQKKYRRSIMQLLEFAGKPLVEITANDIARWRHSRSHLTRATLNKDLVALNRLFEFLLKIGVIDRNPAAEIESFRLSAEETTREVYLTHEEAMRLIQQPLLPKVMPLSKIRARDHAILALLYYTGLRVAELCSLDWEDVHLEDAILLVRSGKGMKPRRVPIPEHALLALQTFRETWKPADLGPVFLSKRNRRISTDAVRDLLDKYVQAAAIQAHGDSTRVTPHVLRHSYATYLTSKGVGMQTLGKLMGNPTAVQRYTHMTDETMKRTAKLFDE